MMNDEILKDLNEHFQAKARLGIMTILTSIGTSDFTSLKSHLGLSDGNLSSHLRVLENAGYIKIEKKFIKRKPKTLYQATPLGRKDFLIYLEQLKTIIRIVEQEENPTT